MYAEEELGNTEIWIYTDNADWFRSFKDCPLPLHFREVNHALIQQWRGKIDFVHRVKIEVLKDMVSSHEGNILYADTDVVFTHRIDNMLQGIADGKLYMHVMEGIVSGCGNPVLTKLYNYLQGHSAMKVDGKPIYDLAMWNAGVLGFNTRYHAVLDDVLTFTDTEYPKFSKHVIEQFAFSVFMQQAAQVHTAAPGILHYWNLKEARQVLASFFDHCKGKTWRELTIASMAIQMHVLMQEKMNFLANRSVADKLMKKNWQPAHPDWKELLKQVP